MQSSTQGHGIYIADANDIVQNNIVYNNSGIGITTWHACTNVTISNNLVWGNLDDGIQIGDGDDPGGVVCDNSIVSNNISIYNGNFGIEEEGSVGANNVFLNNCLYGNSVASTSLELGHVAQNIVTANADFVNWQADGSGDYQLAAGSPCIGAGTSVGMPATDFNEVARPADAPYDIGPYQYTSTPTPTPTPTSSIGDPGFEQVVVGAGHFQYDPTGSPWAFSGSSGISGNNSGFTSGNPPAPQGSQVAFLQETGSFTQTVADWAAGSYVLTFDAARRGNFGVSQENFNVLIDGKIVGTFTPSGTSYQSYSTAAFTVTAGPLTITFQGLDSAGGDNTAFLDQVAVAPASTSSIGDPGFEQVVVGAGHFQYDPTGSPWAFSGSSGISGNNSGFTSGNPPAPQGSQVAFLQETGSFTQTVADWAAGSYVLTFDAARRGNNGVSRQNFNVLIDANIVGTFTPSGTSFQSYSTAAFTVTTAGPLTITFQGLDSAGGDNTAFIDGVSVS